LQAWLADQLRSRPRSRFFIVVISARKDVRPGIMVAILTVTAAHHVGELVIASRGEPAPDARIPPDSGLVTTPAPNPPFVIIHATIGCVPRQELDVVLG
jgi:hypothetical protein